MQAIQQDIHRQTAEDEYRNKHGLYKKPPTSKPARMTVDVNDEDYADEPDSPVAGAPRIATKR